MSAPSLEEFVLYSFLKDQIRYLYGTDAYITIMKDSRTVKSPTEQFEGRVHAVRLGDPVQFQIYTTCRGRTRMEVLEAVEKDVQKDLELSFAQAGM